LLRAAAAFACIAPCFGCGSVPEAADAGDPGFHVEASVCNDLPIAGASIAVETREGFPVPTVVRADPPDGTYVLMSYVAFDGAVHPATASRTLVIEAGRNWHLARTQDGGAVVHVDYEFLGPGVPEEGAHRLYVRCGPGPTEPVETYPDGNGFVLRTVDGGPVSLLRYLRIH
jgi:hypothetical protein